MAACIASLPTPGSRASTAIDRGANYLVGMTPPTKPKGLTAPGQLPPQPKRDWIDAAGNLHDGKTGRFKSRSAKSSVSDITPAGSQPSEPASFSMTMHDESDDEEELIPTSMSRPGTPRAQVQSDANFLNPPKVDTGALPKLDLNQLDFDDEPSSNARESENRTSSGGAVGHLAT